MDDDDDLFNEIGNEDVLQFLEHLDSQHQPVVPSLPATNLLYNAPSNHTRPFNGAQQRPTTTIHAVPVREPTQGSRTNWDHATITTPTQDTNQESNLIAGLQMRLERKETELDQERQANDAAKEDIRRYISELAFKNQELESARADVKTLKKRLDDSASVSSSTTSHAPDHMTIDDPDTSTPISSSARPRMFPCSRTAFSPIVGVKRQRLSVSHNMENLRIQSSQSPAPSTFTPPAPVAPPPPPPPVVDEAAQRAVRTLKRQQQEEQKTRLNLYACLCKLPCIESSVDPKASSISLDLVDSIGAELKQHLTPKRLSTLADHYLAAVADLLVSTLARVQIDGIQSTLLHAAAILHAYMQATLDTKNHVMLPRAIHVLAILVKDHPILPVFLCQELRLDNDSQRSLAHTLVDSLARYPLHKTNDGPDQSPKVRQVRDLPLLPYDTIMRRLDQYHLNSATAPMLLNGVTGTEAKEITTAILDTLLAMIKCDRAPELADFFFVLRHDAFQALLQRGTPLDATRRALLIAERLASSNQLDLRHKECLFRPLAPLIQTPRPREGWERLWYAMRLPAFNTMRIMAEDDTLPLSVATWHESILPALLFIVNNELRRFKEANDPPHPRIYNTQLFELVTGALCLLTVGLTKYPDILMLDDQDNYHQILEAVSLADPIIQKHCPPDHDVQDAMSLLSDFFRAKIQKDE
ncbi:hypothetical protein BC940DRAFT_363402 [Gongronella butleri]|nr:hypothetical protein BC940DRAFT_363402 [Gongronella butleri]